MNFQQQVATPGIFAPGTPATLGDLDDLHITDEQRLRWYQKPRRPKKKGHPYELKAIVLQTEGEKQRWSHAQFWPWVGPFKPKRTVEDVHWDDWQYCVAIAADDKLVVGRCDDEKGWELLWEVLFPGEILYQVAWTFNLFTLHPLVLCGGQLGLIYVIDAVTRSCVRILRGHGAEILCLRICPSHPHILASTAGDKTVRIWNLHGSEAPEPEQGTKPSENYPMGDADEGNVLVAILVGEGGGGHRSQVVGCAFHPKHRAIATCGGDYAVKIWSLPPFPAPDPAGPPTPRGYRAKHVYFPVFSTNRIHAQAVDNIEWLAEDVLISRDCYDLNTWHWLGYKRFFHPNRFAPVNYEAQRTDYHESHSFMIISQYTTDKLGARWYILTGVHHAFHPTEEEAAELEKNPHLVTDFILALPVEGRPPEIQLINPALAQPQLRPDFITESRPMMPYDQSYEVEEEEDEEGDDHGGEDDVQPGDQMQTRAFGEGEWKNESPKTPSRSVTAKRSGSSEIKTYAKIISPSESRRSRPVPPRVSTVPKPVNTVTDEGGPNKRIKTMKPIEIDHAEPPPPPPPVATGRTLFHWSLHARDWKGATRMSTIAQRMPLERSVSQACTISPRGAKWIVGVGDCQSILVYRVKDP